MFMVAFTFAKVAGWRRATRRVAGITPWTGIGATSTAPAGRLPISQRCTTRPPMEWPTTTSGAGSAAAAASRSAT